MRYEFASVAVAHLLAVASPGPDLAVVLKQSLAHGRRAALWCSVGIGCGIFLHVAYSICGVGLLLKSSPRIFTWVTYAGALYLAWIGAGCLRAKPRDHQEAFQVHQKTPSDRGAWSVGFLTNALNPKATLFFLALFTTVVDRRTPHLIQAAYGIWMAFATAAWFSLVATVLARARVRQAYMRNGHWIDRVMGAGLLALAARLALQTL